LSRAYIRLYRQATLLFSLHNGDQNSSGRFEHGIFILKRGYLLGSAGKEVFKNRVLIPQLLHEHIA
jgi:hypothetical protein